MKRLVMLLLLIGGITLTSSCTDISIGKGGKKLKASKNIVLKEYKMKPFDALDIDIVAAVKIEQSTDGDYRVAVQAPDNYVDLFELNVSDGELDVDFSKRNVSIEAKKIGIVIYTPRLRKIENDGVANVKCEKLQTEHLEIENSGVGTMTLTGLTAKRIDVESSGVGNVVLAGSADEAEMECSGVGSIKAEELKARAVKAEVSGVGSIHCYASERLKGEVSGVGSLRYGGDPQEKKLDRSGVGSIKPL